LCFGEYGAEILVGPAAAVTLLILLWSVRGLKASWLWEALDWVGFAVCSFQCGSESESGRCRSSRRRMPYAPARVLPLSRS
jgi:hypothetical protein